MPNKIPNKQLLKIKVKPQAKKTQISGYLTDGTIKIDIKAKPENNQANLELKKILAKQLGVEIDKIKIVKGRRSRYKLIKILN